MKELLKRLLTITAIVCFTGISCSKDNGHGPDPEISGTTWTFGDYTYTRASSSQDEGNTSSPFAVVVVTTSGDGGNYGKFSGSALTFSFPSAMGAGEYSLASNEQMVSGYQTTRLMEVRCVIGTAVNTGTTLYSSSLENGGTAVVTIDKDGKYPVFKQ